MQADDVDSHNLLGLRLEKDLRYAVGLVLSKGLGVRAEVTHTLAKRPALGLGSLLRLCLVQPHEGHLRVGEARGWDVLVVDCVLAADHVLDRRDALGRRGVREHVLAVRVADAPEPVYNLAIGAVEHLHLIVRLHEATHRLDIHVLQAEVHGRRATARRDHAGVDLDRLDVLLGVCVDHLDRHRLDARDPGGHLGREHAEAVVNRTRLDQDALGELGDFTVEARHEVRQRFDEGHLRAKRGVDVRELETDVA
mmetsp:Transcript_19041/g.39756  ORF Transcript_19041/g.39756 Transcript_19041/m.39756 type:complete len:252 (-) Transcript_19041:122-877(-)